MLLKYFIPEFYLGSLWYHPGHDVEASSMRESISCLSQRLGEGIVLDLPTTLFFFKVRDPQCESFVLHIHSIPPSSSLGCITPLPHFPVFQGVNQRVWTRVWARECFCVVWKSLPLNNKRSTKGGGLENELQSSWMVILKGISEWTISSFDLMNPLRFDGWVFCDSQWRMLMLWGTLWVLTQAGFFFFFLFFTWSWWDG